MYDVETLVEQLQYIEKLLLQLCTLLLYANMVTLSLYYRVVILRTMALHHVTNCKRILRKQFQIETFGK